MSQRVGPAPKPRGLAPTPPFSMPYLDNWLKNTPGTPAILDSGLVTITTGQAIELNSGLMQAPNRAPFVIDEIRLFLRYDDLTSDSNLSGLFWIKLSLGHYVITEQFVPSWSFGKYYDELLGEQAIGAAGRTSGNTPLHCHQ